MCFSATASFAASAFITTVGILGYQKAEGNKVKSLAWIPICFGIQQFSEGWVWLSLTNETLAPYLSIFSYVFVFFAWIVWPLLIPFLLFRIETNDTRKRYLKYFYWLGWVVSGTLLIVAVNNGVDGSIQDCAIQYDFIQHWKPWRWFGITYLITTVLSTFVSRIPRIGWFGGLNLLSYFITQLYWHDQLISVWCFLSAIASIVIYWSILTVKSRDFKF